MGLNDPSLYARVASTLLDEEDVGCLVVSSMPGSVVQGTQQVEALLPVLARAHKPAIYTIMGGDSPLPEENRLKIFDAGLCLFRSPERALRAARNVTRRARTLDEVASRVAPREFGALEFDSTTRTGTYVGEYVAKALLSRLGLRVPAGDLATDVDSARVAAARLGYPVVLKVVSAQILHKSDVGGVVVVANEDELSRAYTQMCDRIGVARADAVIDGVLVEEVVNGGIEMIVGARRDVDWGNTVLVGLGGVWAEVMGDVIVLAADADRSEILTGIDSLRGAASLRGARGGMMADLDALVSAIELIGGVLRATPGIAEIEVNPLVVLPQGEGVVALDALIVAQT